MSRLARSTRSWKVAAVAAGVTALLGFFAAPTPAVTPSPAPDPRSGVDNPETGLQGQVPLADQQSGRSRAGYWKGTRLVGANDIAGLGSDIQLTWRGDCAYAVAPPSAEGEGDGIAVLDVRNPKSPKLVRIIRDPLTKDIHEGLHVSQHRPVLVAPAADSSMLGIYDVSDCRNPVHIRTFDTGVVVAAGLLKSGLHSGKLSPDGRVFYGTSGYHAPCFTAVDLTILDQPRVIGAFGDFGCHDLDLSPDGTRAYLGWGGGEQLPGVFVPPLGRPDDVATGLAIADVSGILEGRFEVVSMTTGGRSHTETPFRVGGRDFVVATEEAHCPGGDARIVDVTDASPVQIAELRMEVNSAAHCAEVLADMQDRPFLFYSSHYVSVDDTDDASLLFLTHYASGLRVFDIRNPANPVEVAYYNPPVGPTSVAPHDYSTTYVRWDAPRRHMWFGSAFNGFQVVELTARLGAIRSGQQTPELAAPPVVRATLAEQAWICALGDRSGSLRGR